MINDLLSKLEAYQLAVIVISLLSYATFYNRRNTFVVTCFIYICLCIAHIKAEPYLYEFGEFLGVKNGIAITWYTFFSLTDFIYVYASYKAHDLLNIKTNWLTNFVVVGVLVMGFLQIASYVDRVVLKAGALDQVYTFAIPSINISVTIAIIGFIIGSFLVSGFRFASSRGVI
jgi:hypothetical protein